MDNNHMGKYSSGNIALHYSLNSKEQEIQISMKNIPGGVYVVSKGQLGKTEAAKAMIALLLEKYLLLIGFIRFNYDLIIENRTPGLLIV